MSLRNELVAALRSWDIKLGHELDDHTSLIKSGILDSLALLKLALWIEQQTGGKLDPATFEFSKEWDSITKILDFIERRNGNRIAEVGMGEPNHAKTTLS